MKQKTLKKIPRKVHFGQSYESGLSVIYANFCVLSRSLLSVICCALHVDGLDANFPFTR